MENIARDEFYSLHTCQDEYIIDVFCHYRTLLLGIYWSMRTLCVKCLILVCHVRWRQTLAMVLIPPRYAILSVWSNMVPFIL